jgi:hypothetical protein
MGLCDAVVVPVEKVVGVSKLIFPMGGRFFDCKTHLADGDKKPARVDLIVGPGYSREERVDTIRI